MVSNNPTDRQIEDAFLELAKLHQIQISKTFYLAPNYLSRYVDSIKRILDQSYHLTRGDLAFFKLCAQLNKNISINISIYISLIFLNCVFTKNFLVYILLVDTHAVADLARHLHSSSHIPSSEYVLVAVEGKKRS